MLIINFMLFFSVFGLGFILGRAFAIQEHKHKDCKHVYGKAVRVFGRSYWLCDDCKLALKSNGENKQ